MRRSCAAAEPFPRNGAGGCPAATSPSIITRAVTELCKAYNKFYYENRIIVEEAPVREARVRLTRAVKNTIKTGLYLIGIEAPERM